MAGYAQAGPDENMAAARWPTLAAACLLDTMAGITYAFALYSTALQRRFNLSQKALDGISTAENSAGFLLISGFPYRFCGPRVTLLLTLFVGVPAWLGMWASIVITDWDAPYWLLCLFAWLQYPRRGSNPGPAARCSSSPVCARHRAAMMPGITCG